MLDSIKPGLYVALGIVMVLLWNAWQQEHVNNLPVNVVPQQERSHNIDIPDVKSQADEHVDITPTQAAGTKYITIETNVIKAKINLHGGSIEQLVLKKFPESLEQDANLIHLLDNSAKKLYVAQSGIAGAHGPDTPQGTAIYSAKATDYKLLDTMQTLPVTLVWKNNTGLILEKTFVFKRDKYDIEVEHKLTNNSNSSFSGRFYAQIKRDNKTEKKSGLFNFPTYTGAAISSADKRFEKISFDDMQESPLAREVKGGWISMVQHYFVSAWIPDEKEVYKFSSVASKEADIYRIRMLSPTLQAKPGETVSTKSKFYAGPEVTSELEKVAPNLDLTVDYGMFWPISQALFWLLKKLHMVLGNWGLAIIAATVLIKLAFFKLSASSYRSMANMRRLQPKLTALKERYGDDKQKMSQAMIELYKKEKLNPLGGCLPVLVQIPVFIALYWVLIESVELRQAPFYFWIHDLSVKDPYYVLPLIMGASMFVQQKLNPTPPDPVQAQVMMFLPVVFTLLFMSFPAGLLLYWVANNTISILQQWYITNKVEAGIPKKKK